MCILNRIVEQSGSNQSGWVCHIYHQKSTNLIGNLAHTLVVPLAAVSRTTTNNKLRLMLNSKSLHMVVVYTSSLRVEVVANGII